MTSVTMVIFAAMACALILPMTIGHSDTKESPRAEVKGSSALYDRPLIDGHNDLADNLYKLNNNQLSGFDFNSNLLLDSVWGPNLYSHTDLPRLRTGRVGAQVFSAFVPCDSQHKDAVARTIDQIEVLLRLISKHSDDMALVKDSAEMHEAIRNNKLASLLSVEGGHSIDDRLSVLRTYYLLGVRSMALTHTCNQPWIDSSAVDADPTLVKRGLSTWGESVIKEMNRLGMMIDLSRASHGAMHAVLDVSEAPVIFSHSASYAVYPHYENVQDDVLQRMVSMVHFE